MHTQTIRQLLPTNCLRVFDHFVGLALKELSPLLFTIVLEPLSRKISSGCPEKLLYDGGLALAS